MNRRPVAALLAVLLLAACSTGSGGSTATPSSAAGGVTIGLAGSSAGDYLVGADGHALYVLTTDTANTSTCTGGCATNWPPATVSAGQSPAAGTGVTAQLGTMTRADGTLQVTANGKPLYAFAGDKSATDITGQGQSGVWFLAAPDGSAVGASGSSPSPTTKPSGSDDYY